MHPQGDGLNLINDHSEVLTFSSTLLTVLLITLLVTVTLLVSLLPQSLQPRYRHSHLAR